MDEPVWSPPLSPTGWHTHVPGAPDAPVPCAPPPVVFTSGTPPPVVGVEGLAATTTGETTSWLAWLAKRAVPIALGAIALVSVVRAVTTPDFRTWARKNAKDPLIRRWLRDNPPPEEWRGTPLEWAFLNMPAGVVTGRPFKVL